jgi:capsid assembly protease
VDNRPHHIDLPSFVGYVSIGGEIAGCLDLSDQIFEARAQKPITAILDESAYGAAYVIASAADELTLPRTGGAGSVGIAMMHLDASGALDTAGIGVTLITHGAHKADGNEFAPLPSEVRERFQQDINTIGDLFVETVARNRGLSVSTVRKQQAATFLGPKAVSAGLADHVLSPEAAFEEVAAFVSEMRR